MERVKADLSNFLVSIKQNDFSTTYSKHIKDKYDLELSDAFAAISTEYKKLRTEKESNFHFLKAIVEHSTVPMLSYREDTDEITLLNQAGKKIFGTPYLKSVQSLANIDQALLQVVMRLNSGEKELLKLALDTQVLSLSISAKQIKLEGVPHKLVSFQNIKAELDEQEADSWQKLIRVLTHEIKNSAIPISTLTSVVTQLITDDNGNLKDLNALDEEDLNDLKIGVNTIEKRSKGLVNFVNAYSKLANIPPPQLSSVNSKSFIEGILLLLKSDLSHIHVQSKIDDFSLYLDSELMEQVLINIIKNAKEALRETEQPMIIIRAFRDQDTVIIKITDNGPGISAEDMENIFVPFFTTKKEGSGIGLSLSRQIVRAHRGDLTVKSTDGETSFYIKL
ncbi:sensor histidine kinase [Fulvivirga ligni]|uniref:sensor histidine kinase n=1 Tax=Fulvivirga ligni TaxID=2904246 RepID=UPI001F1DE6DD|nr:ATP-binding protein [Fulvivirga ligni]UII19463.1 ATP-binding protein [Fulvivirga ligni]